MGRRNNDNNPDWEKFIRQGQDKKHPNKDVQL